MNSGGGQIGRKPKYPMILVGTTLIMLSVALLVLIVLRKKEIKPIQDSSDRKYMVPVAVNYAAPDLSLDNLNGRNETLADFKGQVVLVNNWATWCPPCKAEMPTLIKFHNDHHYEGLAIIAIEAGEPREQVLQYVKKFGMPFTVWLDPNGKALTAFANQNLPSSYVLDRKGTVRYTWTGEISRDMLDKYIKPLLSE